MSAPLPCAKCPAYRRSSCRLTSTAAAVLALAVWRSACKGTGAGAVPRREAAEKLSNAAWMEVLPPWPYLHIQHRA